MTAKHYLVITFYHLYQFIVNTFCKKVFISDYIHILLKMGKLIIGGVNMTYNDKNFKFQKNIKEIIAKNIRKYRIEKGYTQEQLAVYTDRSYEFIRRIETDYGERGFSIETLYRISVVLEKDMNSFFEDND